MMEKTASKTKGILRSLIKGEKGAGPLMIVLVLLVVGGLVIGPAMAFVVSGSKQGRSHEESMQRFYSADTGIEDAMWRIRNYEDEDWTAVAPWMTGAWTDNTYTHAPPYWEYTLPGSDNFNDKAVTVRIGPTWLLEGLEDPDLYDNGRTAYDNVTTTGDVVSTQVISSSSYQGRYEVGILKDSGFTDPLIVDKIGVWLPTGFSYVAGSSNLESTSNPLPPTGSRCTPTTFTFRNGTAIVWTYATPIDYTKLPMDKSGKATSVTSGRLIDNVNYQFTASDAGRSVYNATDDKWGLITAYNSTSNLTVSPSDLFDTVNDRYEIGDTNRRVVSFSFTGPRADSVNKLPDGAFCWVSSPGNTTPYVPPYLWWKGDKLYEVVSIGTDPVNGETTTMTIYTTKEQLREFGGAVAADYAAIGNCLMTYSDYSSDPDHRDKLYEATPASLTSLPAGAHAQQLRLYWSGWKSYPWDIWPLSDEDRSLLVPDNFLDHVSLKVEVGGTSWVYQGTIIADSWQVLPHGLSSDPRGWNYSCYADVTQEVEDFFTAHGVTFRGNATYTVGHADVSAATTQSLQGVWGSSGSDVFQVGAAGTIMHYDGTGWDWMTSGTTSGLYAVWGRSATDVFAVGAAGTILHYDGTAWTSMTSGTNNRLNGVWGDSSYTYVVGASGTIRRCAVGSTTWSAMTYGSGTVRDLYGVWGNSSYIYAVGGSGAIRRVPNDGTLTWTAMTSGVSGALNGVWGNSSYIYAAGASGAIRRCAVGSTTWGNAVGSGSTSSNLYSIWGDSSYIYVVGASGTVRRCAVASTAWSAVASGTTTQLNGVWGSAYNDVFVVGGGGSVRHYDGTAFSSMVGAYGLYPWGGSSVTSTTDYPLGNTKDGSGNLHAAAFAAWSMVVLYSSPETKGHQLYLYDTFRYWDKHLTQDFTVPDFLAPQDVLTDPNAARLTLFVGEGDENLPSDQIKVNGTALYGGLPYACNPVTDVWNSKSSVVGMGNIGIDIDTFNVGYPVVSPGDTSAVVRLSNDEDTWVLVYMIVSFRSELTTGGISSLKVE